MNYHVKIIHNEASMIKFFVTFSMIFFYSKSSFANCEAGAFLIHTTTAYLNNPKIQILKGSPKRLLNIDNGNPEIILSEVKLGEFKLIDSNYKCKNLKLEAIPFVEGVGEEYSTYKISNCAEIVDTKDHYYVFDTIKKTVSIGINLDIKPDGDKILAKNAEIEAFKLIENSKFATSTEFSKNSWSESFSKEDIINSKKPAIEHTYIGDKFVMSIASLEIKNISKYYGIYSSIEINK